MASAGKVELEVSVRDRIAVGLGTIGGLAGSSAAALVPLVGELADTTRPLGVPSAVWVVTSAGLLTVVVVGRMAQAVAAVLRRPLASSAGEPTTTKEEG